MPFDEVLLKKLWENFLTALGFLKVRLYTGGVLF